MVSNAPSPTSSPWSKGEMRASFSSTTAPFHQTFTTPPSRCESRACFRGACSQEELRGLELGFLPFRRGAGVGDDPASDTELRAIVHHCEGADGHREIALAALGVDPSVRAAVDAATHGFEILDRLEHARLRRAGHGRRWERRINESAESYVVT